LDPAVNRLDSFSLSPPPGHSSDPHPVWSHTPAPSPRPTGHPRLPFLFPYCTARHCSAPHIAARLHRSRLSSCVPHPGRCRAPDILPSLLSPAVSRALGFKRPPTSSSPPFLVRQHCPLEDLLATRSHFPTTISHPLSTEDCLCSVNSVGAPLPPPLLGESCHRAR
jgi:hypothetical protein